MMNEEIPSDSGRVYPAIYDFALLPYALGDILTWNVKACIKAELAGKKDLDVYLCADPRRPACRHQPDFNSSNYQSQLFELFQAFYCNPRLRNLHVYSDRRSFGAALQAVPQDHEIIKAALAEHEGALLKADHRHDSDRYGASRFLVSQCSSFAEVNAFHAAQGRIPKLITPPGCRKEVMEFRQALGKERCVVAVNFRTRDRDSSIPNIEPERNASSGAWYDFFKLAERKFPGARFLLLGKTREKPPMFMQLGNVLLPRLYGLHLGHELGLVEICDFFMGSCSGFAMMAALCDTPYVITKVQERARDYFGIPADQDRLLFAGEGQRLVHEEESVQILLSHFGRMHGEWEKGKAARSSVPSGPEAKTQEGLPAIHPLFFTSPEALDHDLGRYLWEKTLQAGKMMESGNPGGALALLERLTQEHPSAVKKQWNFHGLRAMALIKMQKLPEAKEALEEELTCHPSNHEARDFKRGLELLMRQRGLMS